MKSAATVAGRVLRLVERFLVETEVLLDRLMYVPCEWREARIARRRRSLRDAR